MTGFVSRFVTQADSARVCQWIDHGRADGGTEHRSAARFWTLDPIDGTKGFLRGDQYAVALALIEGGQVQVGVLGCPGLSDGYRPELDGQGSLVIAVRGQGAWTTSLAAPENYDRLHVSTRRDPAQARLLRSFETGHTNVSQIDLFARALGVQAEPVLMDSQAKYAVLAAGKGDLLLRLFSASQTGLSREDLGPGRRLFDSGRSRRLHYGFRRPAARFHHRPVTNPQPGHPGLQ